MAWAHVQNFANNASNSSSSSNAFGFTSNTTIGNFLFLCISLVGNANNNTPTVSSVTGLATWSKIGGVANGSGQTGIDVEIWAGTCTSAGQAFTINVSSGPANIQAVGGEFSGGSLSLDSAGVKTTTGSGTTATTGTLTTTNAADLLIAGLGTATNSASSSMSGTFTEFGALNQAGSGSPLTGGCGETGGYRIVSATGSYSTSNSIGFTSGNWATVIVGFQQVAVVSVNPPTLRHRQQPKRIPHVKAKHAVRGHIQAAPATVPAPPLRHKPQPKHVPHVKAKHPIKSGLPFHAPQAAAATPIFPPTLRHGRIAKRIPHVKAKPVLRSSLELRIAQATVFPPGLRHRQQPKRVPHTKAKHPLHSFNEIVSQAAPSVFPPELRHRQQPKRAPTVKAKRPIKSSLPFHAPQAAAPTPIFPLPIFTGHVKKKRLPKIPFGRNRSPFLFARFKGTVTPPGQDAIVLWRKRRGY